MAQKKAAQNGANGATAPPEDSPVAAMMQIDPIETERVRVPIVGLTPLIVHRFSEKAKKQMLDNMQGKKTPKKKKDPAGEFEGSFYRFEDGKPGFPILGFKAATVSAARFYDKSVSMASLRQLLFFRGQFGVDGVALAPLTGEATMREDVVRVGNGGSDLRYRAEFREWSSELDITYVKSALSTESVLSLVNAGGLGVGVGDWRPEKKGDHGMFQVDTDAEIVVGS